MAGLGIAILAVATLGFVGSHTLWQALSGRIGMGVGGSLLYPATVRLLARSFGDAHRGFAVGILEGAQGIEIFSAFGVLLILAR